MRTLLFYLATSILLAHELDAVKHSEWGLLYVLRDLPSGAAYAAFVLLHVPLITIILWLSHHRNETLRSRFRLLVCVFTICHALIHLRLDGSENYYFEGWLANGLIFGSASFGIVYCCLVLVDRARSKSATSS